MGCGGGRKRAVWGWILSVVLFVTSNSATFRISRRVSQENRDKGGERQRQKDGETQSEIARQRESQQRMETGDG